jgi:hypothetical protein
MTSTRYAQNTEVPIGRSRDEIERTLERFGASGQIWARDDEKHVVTVAFRRQGKVYRFTISLPSTPAFATTPTGRQRGRAQAETEKDKETRRRFRSLANYVKALLDAIDTGIVTAEEALLPYMMLPSGDTVYTTIQAQLTRGHAVDLSRALSPGGPTEVKTPNPTTLTKS